MNYVIVSTYVSIAIHKCIIFNKTYNMFLSSMGSLLIMNALDN